MTKADQRTIGLVAGTAAALLFLQWLRSNPQCDRGCQTQLEPLQEHVLDSFIRTFLA